MYRSCIFCSADLGSNDVLERFPIGRSVAFDGAKGRLWAVCPKCARWNLAPLEERWEAMEDAERLFRGTRTRVQAENVGLARLPDGTRLVRIGSALAGELAAWRYGSALGRRRRRYLLGAGAAAATATGLVSGIALGTGLAVSFVAVHLGLQALLPGLYLRATLQQARTHSFPAGTVLREHPLEVDASRLRKTRFTLTPDGEVGLQVWTTVYTQTPYGFEDWCNRQVVLDAFDTHALLRRGMVWLNATGAGRSRVRSAVDLLTAAGSADAFLRRAARDHAMVDEPLRDGFWRAARRLAVEMAVHDALERRALEGELAALRAAWREAEEIAAIADRLPDEVPAADPLRG
jgi:hypothetical protein